jgi:Flp pilus assembly pilin Flp
MNWRAIVRTIDRQVLRDEGQDLLEYALLGALIAVTAIAGVSKLGTTVNSAFWEVIANYR